MNRYRVRYYLPQRKTYRSRVIVVWADSPGLVVKEARKKIRKNETRKGEPFLLIWLRDDDGKYLSF